MTPLFAGGPVRMFRLSNAPGERGLSCTPDGVALGGVPLVRKTPAGFVPRPAAEIASLFKTAFGDQPMTLQSRLGAITQALNRGDFATAMIAAVHTQTPVLTAEAAARLAQADRELTKYDYNPEESRDWHGRWTADGSSAPAAPTTPAIDADQRTARADTPPLRVAENTLPSDGAVASDAPAPSAETAPERRHRAAIPANKPRSCIVSSSDGKVQRSVRKLLQPGEIDVTGVGHAEIIGVEAAKDLGLNPTGVAASRPICGPCADYLRDKRIAPLTRLRR
jgi:hypothetical protein